jgi:hypothetical protein
LFHSSMCNDIAKVSKEVVVEHVPLSTRRDYGDNEMYVCFLLYDDNICFADVHGPSTVTRLHV